MKKRLLCLILVLVMCLCLLPTVSSAAIACQFPLPKNAYNVTVLSHYSDGSVHESYLTEYTLKGSPSDQPYCIMDIAAGLGTEVYACADGTVVERSAKPYDYSGYVVVLRHTDGSYSYYGHLNGPGVVTYGQTVTRGQLIGYVGESGYTTGAHLQFEWTNHDPYCEFRDMGYDLRLTKAAAKYPHNHSGKPVTFSGLYADGITQTNAVLHFTSTALGVGAYQVGLEVKNGSDVKSYTYPKSFTTSSALNSSYNLNTECGIPLDAGTTYQWRCFIKTATATYYCDDYQTFTTAGTPAHTHSYAARVVAPTCTAQGYTVHTCSCGESYTDSYTAALGHDYKNGVCTRCGGEVPSMITGKCGENLTWTLTRDTLTISGTGEMGNYPSSGSPWYDYRDLIKSVVIKSGVTTIGNGAFWACDSLTSVTIPNSVTTIGNYAFYDCTSLTNITIPNSVTSIGIMAFENCSSLTGVTIPTSITTIGIETFCGCSKLTSVIIPGSVKTISGSAFYGCNSLTDVYYGGTQTQWDTIAIASGNARLTAAMCHFTAVQCDLNGDGVTDSADLTLLSRHVAGIELLEDTSRADVTGDGQVSAADLTALAEIMTA